MLSICCKETWVLMQGALSIDESASLAQSVCSGNSNSAVFFLLPQPHSSCNLSTVFKHRRLMEDKVIAILGSKQLRVSFHVRFQLQL